MDRLMKYRLITTSLLFSLVTACGGGSNTSDPDPSPDPTPSTKNEFKSIVNLAEGLPVENSALDTNSPAGIWYVKTSQKSTSKNTPSSVSSSSIANSESFIIITEEENNYLMPLCGTTIDTGWFKDIQLSLQESKFSYSGGSFFSRYNIDVIKDDYTVSLSLSNNLMLTGESAFSYETEDSILQADTNIAATKVSNATTFSSAEELMINFSSQYNSADKLGIDDFDPEIRCISNTKQHNEYLLDDTAQVLSVTSSTSNTILDSNYDTSYFLTLISNADSEPYEINQYHYALNNDEAQSGTEGCDNSSCETFNEFTFSNSSLNNTIMAVSSVKKSNGDSLEIELSIAIK